MWMASLIIPICNVSKKKIINDPNFNARHVAMKSPLILTKNPWLK